jgi:hypothetical protein
MRDLEKIRGFVAVIDVLGFREMVTRSDDLSHVKEYITTVVSLFENNQNSKLQFVLFSDNLIVNTTDDSESSFGEILRACSGLFCELTNYQIAIRGAIAHGSFMRSETTSQGVILAGRPIIEALYYQDQQGWLGIILAPSVIRYDERIQKLSVPTATRGESDGVWLDRNRLALRLQRWPRIPFHVTALTDEGHFDGYAVVPMRFMLAEATDTTKSLAETMANLEKMRAAAPDPRSQKKYSESLKWVASVQQRCQENIRELEFTRRG